MAEGRTLQYYRSDLVHVFDNAGLDAMAQFAMSIPNNLVAEAKLGWSGPDATIPVGVKLPRRVRPRHAVGKNSDGKRVKAICATVTCDLWTGVATDWSYIDNFGATKTATVTGRVGEAVTIS